jgi:hypothetical protein
MVAIALMFLTAALAALSVPLLVWIVVKFGLSDPISFDLLGRAWRVEPWEIFARESSHATLTVHGYSRVVAASVVVSFSLATADVAIQKLDHGKITAPLNVVIVKI